MRGPIVVEVGDQHGRVAGLEKKAEAAPSSKNRSLLMMATSEMSSPPVESVSSLCCRINCDLDAAVAAVIQAAQRHAGFCKSPPQLSKVSCIHRKFADSCRDRTKNIRRHVRAIGFHFHVASYRRQVQGRRGHRRRQRTIGRAIPDWSAPTRSCSNAIRIDWLPSSRPQFLLQEFAGGRRLLFFGQRQIEPTAERAEQEFSTSGG